MIEPAFIFAYIFSLALVFFGIISALYVTTKGEEND